MDAPNTPPKVPRPYRLMVNIDAETYEGLRALSAVSGMSRSAVAADALRMLMPTLEPLVRAIGKLRTEPHRAMAELAQSAEVAGEYARETIEEVRRMSGGVPPPSSNTGG